MRLAALPVLVVVACTDAAGPAPAPSPPWGAPITGGTMLITAAGGHAVIADPDRDRVLSVDLAAGRVVAERALAPGDQPGRLVEDGAGRVHVALRHGGALLTLDGAAHARVVARRAVCPEPRGVAWDPAADVVHVACAGGELVSLPAAGGAATRRVQLDRDLRDVVVSGGLLVITRLRTAEVLTVDAAGAVVSRMAPPPLERFGFTDDVARTPEIPAFPAIPAVAWRAIGLPDGRVLISHQRQLQGPLATTPDGYGGGCRGRAEPDLTTARPGEPPFAVGAPLLGALPVDLALSRTGDRLAVALAGIAAVQIIAAGALDQPDDGGGGCDALPPATGTARPGDVVRDELGAPTAIAYAPTGELAVFYPEGPALVLHTDAAARTIALPGAAGHDLGRALFHRETAAKLACASCHPEGGDDGLVWDFVGVGRRRTQNLSGGIARRAPYHWAGDLDDLPTLMTEVFTGRMAGGELTDAELAALGPWLDRLPATAPSPGDAAAIARGRALFGSDAVGCAACHAGPLFTDNTRVAVGTGDPDQAFKVPSLLGLASRPPYLHDGCAATLRDRFGACGGGDLHGHTSQLSPAELDDLVAYMESL